MDESSLPQGDDEEDVFGHGRGMDEPSPNQFDKGGQDVGSGGLTTPCHIKAITIQQPFASGILARAKKVENRSWGGPDNRPLPLPSDGRGLWLLLHASGSVAGANDENVKLLQKAWPEMPQIGGLPTSCILGCIHVTSVVHPSDPGARGDPQAVGPLCWLIDDVAPLALPVNCPGQTFLWTPRVAVQLPQEVSVSDGCVLSMCACVCV